MKYLSAIIFFALTIPCHGQWYEVNSNTDQNLNDLFFVTGSHGYSVGTGGVLLESVDNGENWVQLYNNFEMELFEVLASDSIICCVGKKNQVTYLVYSTDYGESWQTINTGLGNPDGRYHLHFQNGIAYFNANGNKLMKFNVMEELLSELRSDVGAYDFMDENKAFCFLNNSYNMVTVNLSDGSIIDTISNSAFISNQFYFSLKLFTENLSYFTFTYNPLSLSSTDQGLSWDTLSINGEPSFYFDAAEIVNIGDSIYMAPSAVNVGFIYYYDVSSNSWSMDNITQGELRGMSKAGDAVLVCGDNGLIMKSEEIALSDDINNEHLKKNINLFPNPSASQIRIEMGEGISIEKMELIDANGNVLKSYTNYQSYIDITGFSSQVYFLRLVTNQGTVNKRVVVQ